MTKRKFFALATAAVVLSATAAAAATPVPRILVIDRSSVLRQSKVGQDVVRQVNAYTEQAEKQLRGESDSLRKNGEALKQQLAILAPDVKARKMREFELRQKGLQEEAQKKQSLIQGGFIKARMAIENTLGPILQGIMVERNANLLLDKQSVLMGTDPSLDITQVAVQRLDQKLPSLHVDLVPPPPGLVPQQPPQQ